MIRFGPSTFKDLGEHEVARDEHLAASVSPTTSDGDAFSGMLHCARQITGHALVARADARAARHRKAGSLRDVDAPLEVQQRFVVAVAGGKGEALLHRRVRHFVRQIKRLREFEGALDVRFRFVEEPPKHECSEKAGVSCGGQGGAGGNPRR